MRLAILVFLALALSLGAPSRSDAFTTKKGYERYLATLPPEGDQPPAEYVQRAALAYFKRALKDPDSAKYEWGSVERGTWKGAFERFGTPGWIATVLVNAKNSYGAYTGFTEYKFVFRSGSIVEIYAYDSRVKDWVPSIGAKGTPIPALTEPVP